jgi:predicted AAA+ superfamily ATPase
MTVSQGEQRALPPAAEPFRPDRVSFVEPSGPSKLLDVFERIVEGGFPRFLQPDPPPIEAFYGSYLQTYIERDVRSILNITNLAAFQRFLRIAAARVAQLLSFSDLARDVGVSVSTITEWIHLLEATFQVYLLRPYFENLGKRQIKTPKLYFRDTGLVSYLTGWRSATTAASGAMAGMLFENYVMVELLKSYRHRGREASIWFYRDKEKREVDFLIAEEGKLYPIEAKLAASPTASDAKGMQTLARQGAPLGKGAVICLIDKPAPLNPLADAVPVAAIN